MQDNRSYVDSIKNKERINSPSLNGRRITGDKEKKETLKSILLSYKNKCTFFFFLDIVSTEKYLYMDRLCIQQIYLNESEAWVNITLL